MQLFMIVVVCVGVFCLAGCDPAQQRTVDPNMLVAGQTDTTAPAADPTPSVSPREQAVGLYVDAMMLNDLNERDDAIRKLNDALELDPTFAMAYSLKGDILQGLEKYEDSANAYEQATLHDPFSFKDFFNLGKVCRIIEQWARAAKAYVSACQLDPQHYPAHLGAAVSYFELKEYDNSLTYAQKAKELNPAAADPELLLGDVFEAQQDPLQAINAYRRALELEGNNPTVMISLARAYLRAGRYSSAKELLSDVIATDPTNSMAHQYLGFAQLKLKETDAAVESYQMAVRVNENDWMARKGLGVAYMLQSMQPPRDPRRQALAVEQWTISLQLKPDQPKLQQLVKRYQ
jgi:tetratricopeptide (TPR) repeat protein